MYFLQDNLQNTTSQSKKILFEVVSDKGNAENLSSKGVPYSPLSIKYGASLGGSTGRIEQQVNFKDFQQPPRDSNLSSITSVNLGDSTEGRDSVAITPSRLRLGEKPLGIVTKLPYQALVGDKIWEQGTIVLDSDFQPLRIDYQIVAAEKLESIRHSWIRRPISQVNGTNPP